MLQRLKVFADDSVEAMAQITRELGGDARIYSTRQVNGGIEIIAGPPEDEEGEPEKKTPRVPRARTAKDTSFKTLLDSARAAARADELQQRKSRVNAPAQPAAPQAAQRAEPHDDRLRALEDAVAEMKSMMLTERMTEGLRSIGATPEILSVFLARSGAHEGKASDQRFSAFLAERLLPKRKPTAPRLLRVTVAFGPSGSGKTTLLGQIAARLKLQNPLARVALINADNNKVGSSDQFRAYGRILEVPVVDIENSTELAEFSRSLDNERHVLIDMPRDPKECARLLATIESSGPDAPPITRIGVIPANFSAAAIAKVLESYGPLDEVAITKMEEADIGIEAIGRLALRKMGVGYFSKTMNLATGLVEPDLEALEALIQTAIHSAAKGRP